MIFRWILAFIRSWCLLLTFSGLLLFTPQAYAQNTLVDYGQPSPTPTPFPDDSSHQASLPPSWGIFNGLGSALSYALTLGNPVHLDHPREGFSRAELPNFTVEIPTKTNQKIGGAAKNTWRTKDELLQAQLLNEKTNQSIPVTIKKTSEGQFHITAIKTENLTPGNYHLVLAAKETFLYTRDLTQDFSWGVLALNTNKSIYTPGETAHLSFGVVDTFGSTICNASLSLTITDPQGATTTLSTDNGKIQQSHECSGNSVTQLPDYLASYQTTAAGYYQMVLTAHTKNGTHMLSDYFQVEDAVPYSVDRSSFPTRVYPLAAYDVKLTITANQDYSGPVTDSVPKAFYITNISDGGSAPDQFKDDELISATNEAQLANDKAAIPANTTLTKLDTVLLKHNNAVENFTEASVDHTPMPIIWQVHFQKGQTYTLSYTINFPPVSPEFYLIGPLKIGDFEEVRQWQIASDATKCWAGTAGANWSANTNTSWVTTLGAGANLATGDVATFDPGTGTCASPGGANTNSTLDTGLGFTTISGINITANYTQTITDNKAMTVSSGNYAQAGGTWSGGSVNMTVSGTFTLSGGTFNATSGTLTIESTYNTTGGTFNAGTGTVKFDASPTQAATLTPSSETYNKVTFDNGGAGNCFCSFTYTLTNGTTLTVANTLTIAQSDSTSGDTLNGGGGISAQGDISLTDKGSNGGLVQGTAVISINGTGTQTMTGVTPGSSGDGGITSIIINKPSGTLNIRQYVTAMGNWTWTQGTVDYTGSTVDFNAGTIAGLTGTITPGPTAFNNVSFDDLEGGNDNGDTITSQLAAGTTLTAAGTVTFADTDTTGNTAINGPGTLAAQGNITTTGSNVGGNVQITLSGSSNQTITQSSGKTFPTGSWTVNKSGGTATLASNLTLTSSGQNLTITGGTLDLAGFSLLFNANSTLAMTGGSLNVQGAEFITPTTRTFTGGTVNYYGSGTYAKMILGTSYYNLTISGSGSWTAATASAVLGTFTQSAGTYTAPSTLTIGGGFSNSGGTFNTNAGAVVFNNNSQTSTIAGANTFYDLTVTTAGKQLVFPASTTTTITHSLTLQGSPQSRVVLRSSSPGTQWNLAATGSYALTALDVEDSNACASSITPLSTGASINSGNNSCWSFTAETTWYNNAWSSRKEIILKHTQVPCDQTNFPVLVTWASDANVASKAQTNGNDILFTSVDGVTKLNHELETYNSGTGELEAWVKVPTLSSTQDTILWMYYGNPSASNQQANPISNVWSDNYIGVWHLKENATGYPTSGEFADSAGSTPNNLTAGQNTHKPAQTTGQISFGQLFNSATAQVATNSAVTGLGNVNDTKTVTLWYKVSSNPGSEQTLVNLQNTTADSLTDRIEFTSAGAFGAVTHNGTQLVTTTAPAANTWHYIAWTYNSSGTANNLSIDAGTPVSHSHAADSAAIGVVALGGNFTGGGSTAKSWSGSLDEVRIANSVLSSCWLQTEYNNESSPSTFESFLNTPLVHIFQGVTIHGGTSIKSN